MACPLLGQLLLCLAGDDLLRLGISGDAVDGFYHRGSGEYPLVVGLRVALTWAGSSPMGVTPFACWVVCLFAPYWALFLFVVFVCAVYACVGYAPPC